MYSIIDFKKNENLKIKLFTSCKIVKGVSHGLICDLDRRQYYRLDIETIFTIESILNKNYSEVTNEISQSDFNTIYEFLKTNELCFFTKNLECFPDISTESSYPGNINNFIIDYAHYSNPVSIKVYDKFEVLGVVGLELRYFFSPSKETIFNELNKSSLSRIRSINIYLKDSVDYNLKFLEDLMNNFPRVSQIFIHSSKEDKILVNKTCTVIYTKKIVLDESCCGVINANNFNTNLEMFNESLNFNSCLNKKMSIDKNGIVKNCPSSKEGFGNVNEIDIIEVAISNTFQTKWTINKDKISVCKDCEFRYICTDCRAYTVEDDLYGKPIKCNYNPTTGEW